MKKAWIAPALDTLELQETYGWKGFKWLDLFDDGINVLCFANDPETES